MFRVRPLSFFLLISSAMLVLLLSACNVPASAPVQAPTEAPMAPIATDVPTQGPVAEPTQGAPALTVDLGGVAQNATSQVVEAVPASADNPWWDVLPQYTVLTLEGYPIQDHLLEAQIFLYPVEGLSVNQVAGQIPGSLSALLQSQGASDVMPYLPPYNAGQVMHAQVAYLDFKNGKGVRYLTQFDQAPLPINNYELHYTFQGLTSDGKYYVAAVLPVNLPDLPEDASVNLENPPASLSDFPTYLAGTVEMLNGKLASAFSPDLSQLDAMMESLEIK